MALILGTLGFNLLIKTQRLLSFFRLDVHVRASLRVSANFIKFYKHIPDHDRTQLNIYNILWS